MKAKKTSLILHPAVIGFFLMAVAIVCGLAFKASERAAIRDFGHGGDKTRVQESLAHYKGVISDSGSIDLPALPDIPDEVRSRASSKIGEEIYGPAYQLPVREIPEGMPLWKKNAVAVTLDPSKAQIVIIIDDMGLNRRRSQEAATLSGPLTLAYLPYGHNLQPLVDEARRNGHEILVHIPMEPESATIDPGPTALRTAMAPDEMVAMVDKNLSAFSGYVGFNNHMGSKLTKDKAAMQLVMTEAVKRGLLVIDSRTAQDSVAGDMAKAVGAAHASRDVFLDHREDINSVREALAQLESVAQRKGFAIAIGHPKDNTLTALREWLPTLASKGFQLVPVSSVVKITELAVRRAGEVRPDLQGPVQPP